MMSPPRLLSSAACFAAAVVFAACSDDGTGPSENRAGTVQFQFSGALAGSFSANGAAEVDGTTGNFVYQPFAFAALESFGSSIIAFQPTVRPRGNAIEIHLNDRSAGTYSTDEESCASRCAIIFYIHDLDFDASTVDGRIFQAVSGEIEVTQFSTDRIEGRFNDVVLADIEDSTAAMQMTNGTFSVSLLGDDLLLSRAPRVGVGALP